MKLDRISPMRRPRIVASLLTRFVCFHQRRASAVALCMGGKLHSVPVAYEGMSCRVRWSCGPRHSSTLNDSSVLGGI